MWLLTKLPRISVFQEILWELYKLNFHLELVSLDQYANRDPVKVDLEIRVQEILWCFPNTSGVSVVTIPYVNAGLVTNDWRERLPFILAFVGVMSCWEGLKPKVFDYWLHRVKELSQNQALELEHEAACFYMQTFFNHFGWASLIPHCILRAPVIWSLCFFIIFCIIWLMWTNCLFWQYFVARKQ